MMKQINFYSSSSTIWSKTEKEVAEIIRDLYRVCLLSSIPFSWGSKRKRSAIQNHPSSSPTKRHRTLNAADASSPATPLSFPATESDDKPKQPHKKTSLKKQKESSLKIIQELSETKASLNQEIENVRHHCDKLKSFNLKLKIRKQELLCNSNGRNKSEFKIPKLDNGKKVQLEQVNGGGSVNTSKSTAENEDQKKKKKKQPMQLQTTTSLEAGSSSSTGSGRIIISNNNGPGPILLPDLNLPTEETFEDVASFQPLDESRGDNDAAAQARQRRLQIFRLKKPLGNNTSKQH